MKAEIKAEELMIGNYLSFSVSNGVGTVSGSGFVTTIEQGHLYLNTIRAEYRMVSGVPLTEEWLFKSVFELCNNYYHKYFDSYRGEIRIKKNGDGYAVRVKRNNSVLWLCSIQYIHQLQNLYFALTGTHLIIEL